jgi:hypothetical protein
VVAGKQPGPRCKRKHDQKPPCGVAFLLRRQAMQGAFRRHAAQT